MMNLIQRLLEEHKNVKYICLVKSNVIKQSQFNFNLLLASLTDTDVRRRLKQRFLCTSRQKRYHITMSSQDHTT